MSGNRILKVKGSEMSLLELAKAEAAEKERKAREYEVERRRREAEEKFFGSHPLLKIGGLTRDVRDAYFQGLVFAAFADDNKVDAQERGKLMRIAQAMGLDEEEVDNVISEISQLDDKKKLSRGEACVSALKNENCSQMFLREFSILWMSHPCFKQEELKDWRSMIGKWIEYEYDAGWFVCFDTIVRSCEASEVVLNKLLQCFPFQHDIGDYLFSVLSDELVKAQDVITMVHGLSPHQEVNQSRQNVTRLQPNEAAAYREENKCFDVWLIRKPEKSFDLIKDLPDWFKSICGGTDKLRDLLYRYGSGYVCGSVSEQEACAIRSWFELYEGIVEIKHL